jgi:iron complex transport system substrate-binding protein
MKIFCIAGFLVSILLGVIIFILPKGPPTFHKTQAQYFRVVTLAPSMSETMVALGQGHLVIGATTHCQVRELAHVERVGSFAEPNFEAILALNPDLVLAVPHVMATKTLHELEKNNIEVFAHQPDSLSDIKYIISALSAKFGVEERGTTLNQSIDQAITHAKILVSQINLGKKKTTALIVISHTPFVVAGKNTFASQIIEALGLSNMADDPRTFWPVWPLENLLSHPPDMLILADGNQNESKYQELFYSLGMDSTKASIRLVVPKKPIFNSPSPAIIEDTDHLIHLLQFDI